MRWCRRAVAVGVLAVDGVVEAAPPTFAPEREKPETITIDKVIWNTQAQAFEAAQRIRFSPAVAGDAAGFVLRVTLEVVGRGPAWAGRLAARGQPQPTDGRAERARLVILYSSLPGGGAVTGRVQVAVTSQLLSPARNPVATSFFIDDVLLR